MLEGLEVSEDMFSSTKKSELFRLEAEFYTAVSFNSTSTYLGSEIIGVSQYGTSDELNEEGRGYPVLRLNEFCSHFITAPSKFCHLLDEESYQSLRLRKGDVLICRTNGNPKLVGKAAIVPKDYDYAYASYLFKIIPKQELITSATLVAYLNSKYGRMEIEKFSMASNQVNFSPAKFREMRIPKFGCSFMELVDKHTFSAFELLENSKLLCTQAETLLLNSLNIADFSPSTKAVNIKTFKESFTATGRLDAEYYQPKFDELEAEIAETHTLVPLSSMLTLNQRGTQPDYAEEGLPVVNSKHVREGEVLLSDNRVANVPDKEEPLLIQNGDVLINGTGVGTIGRSAPYLHEQNAIPDNHVTILRTNKLNPIFLSVYLNSIAGKYQVDKYFKGSSGQIELYPKDIDCFYVPLVDETIQTEIAALVQQSFILKAESERLLEVAKRAVEIAIEQDEKAALDFISRESNNVF